MNKSLFYIHWSVFMFGMAGLFGKLVSLPAMAVTLGRVGFSSLSLFIYLKIRNQRFTLNEKQHCIRLIAAGILLAFHWSAFYYSIQVSTVAVGLLSSATFPVFTMFLEPVFFHEKFRFRNVLLALLALLGILLMSPLTGGEPANLKGIIWGIIAGGSYACITMMNRAHMQWGYPSALITFYEQSTAAAVLFFVTLLTVRVVPTPRDLFLLFILGSVFTAFAHSLFINGLKNITAHTSGLISCMEPVYGIIFAFILLGEKPELRVIIGGILILSVSVFQSLIQSRGINRGS